MGPELDELPVEILPKRDAPVRGLRQSNPPEVASPALRQILAGFLSLNNGWDGIICTADRDTQYWVHVSAGEAISMQGFLTPKLVGHLGGADQADTDAMEATLSRPERLAAHLRQAELAEDGAAITGHLLGAELAAARVYWLGQQVAVISDRPSHYVSALRSQGVAVAEADLAAMEMAGARVCH